MDVPWDRRACEQLGDFPGCIFGALRTTAASAEGWSDVAVRAVQRFVNPDTSECVGGDDATDEHAGSQTSHENEGSPLHERGVVSIQKYLFVDEGESKGTVKVYIEAKELETGLEAVVDARVEFGERALTVRVVAHDGRVWKLHASPLYGRVKVPECRYALSSTGHKLSITLKKEDAATIWHRLTESLGTPESVAHDYGSFF